MSERTWLLGGLACAAVASFLDKGLLAMVLMLVAGIGIGLGTMSSLVKRNTDPDAPERPEPPTPA